MFTFDNLVTSYFLIIDLRVCIVFFWKEIQEVVYFPQLISSVCSACAPLSLSCICIRHWMLRNASQRPNHYQTLCQIPQKASVNVVVLSFASFSNCDDGAGEADNCVVRNKN